MSDRIEWFTITVPANTLQAAPLIVPCVFPQGDVVEIDVIVPPGPSGLTGFFISAGGSQYVPRTPGSFVRADDVYFKWPLTNAINSGSWAVTAFNLDVVNQHVLQFGFQVNELHNAGQGALAPGSSSDALASALAGIPAQPAIPDDPLSPGSLLLSLPAVPGGLS